MENKFRISIKKVVFVFMIFSFINARGQQISNFDFSTFIGSMGSAGGCPYFTSSNLPNWFIVTGTPNGSAHFVHIWGDDVAGGGPFEAFAGNYHFIPGVTYTLRVGISSFTGAGCGNSLRILAANNLTEHIPTMGCAGTFPYLTSSSDTQSIGNFVSTSSVSNVVFQVTFTPSIDYYQILLYPNACASGFANDVDLDSVSISSCVSGSIYYNSTSEIVAGGATQVAHITAGSGSSVDIVKVNPAKTTVFIGREINLVPQFYASMNSYRFFLAIPDVCADTGRIIEITGPCDSIQESTICEDFSTTLTTSLSGGSWSILSGTAATFTAPGVLTAGSSPGTVKVQYSVGGCTVTKNIAVVYCPLRPAHEDSTKGNVAMPGEISVFPNPTTDNVTISYPCNAAGQMNISIKDVAGRTRFTENVTCNDGGNIQHNVDFSKYTPGVYFIDLTLNDQHVVKKIVKL